VAKPDLVALSAVATRILRALEGAPDTAGYFRIIDHASFRHHFAEMRSHTPGLAAQITAASGAAYERITGWTLEGYPAMRTAA
jgi:hypothetical protein